MICVNLLGAQAARRHGETWWQLSLTLLALLVLAAAGARLHGTQNDQLTAQRDDQRLMQAEMRTLQPLLRQAAQLKVEKEDLEHKVSVIDDLMSARRQPAQLLATISQSLPEHLWLDSIRDTDEALEIIGKSFDNEHIAAFMENLGAISGTPFSHVVLVESKAGMLHGRSIVAFTVSAHLAPGGNNAGAERQTE